MLAENKFRIFAKTIVIFIVCWRLKDASWNAISPSFQISHTGVPLVLCKHRPVESKRRFYEWSKSTFFM